MEVELASSKFQHYRVIPYIPTVKDGDNSVIVSLFKELWIQTYLFNTEKNKYIYTYINKYIYIYISIYNN